MKKTNCFFMLSVLFLLCGWIFLPVQSYAAETGNIPVEQTYNKETFYNMPTGSIMLPVEDSLPDELLQSSSAETIKLCDDSYSMRVTFSWERNQIAKNWSEYFSYDDLHLFRKGENQTNLWETLNSCADQDWDTIFCATDLWDDNFDVLNSTSTVKNLVLLVPYNSQNKEGFEHVNNCVTNILLKKWYSTNVYVTYLDNKIFTYAEFDTFDPEFTVDIEQPDEISPEMIEHTADKVTSSVMQDVEIGQDSIIVTDFSGSMSTYMTSLYEYLLDKDTISKMENCFIFSDNLVEIAPNELSSQSLKEAYFSLSGGTDLIPAVQRLTSLYPDGHIYLITDLMDNSGVFWSKDLSFKGTITVHFYSAELDADIDYAESVYHSMVENYPNGIVEIIES